MPKKMMPSHIDLVKAAEDINSACVLEANIPLTDDAIILRELKDCDKQLTLDDGLNTNTLLFLRSIGVTVMPGVKKRTNKRAEKIFKEAEVQAQAPKESLLKVAKAVYKDKSKRPTPLPSAGGDGQPGIIDTIKAALLRAGRAGLTKIELLAMLKQAFPTRPEKGMKTTINVNVPTRLNKRTKINIIRKGDRFVATGTL